MKQLNLIPKPIVTCGGSLKNTRKHRRILSSKAPIHLVLKSNSNTLRINKGYIQKVLFKQSKLAEIKIYKLNVNINHIHLAIKVSSSTSYKRFIRASTGLMARKLGRGLWKFRPFTRVCSWGRAFEKLKSYIELNEYESHYGIRLRSIKIE